jgi:hypothetical protein
MEVIPPGSNPTIYRCLKSPGPQVWSQLASPIPVVSFWSTQKPIPAKTQKDQDQERIQNREPMDLPLPLPKPG